MITNTQTSPILKMTSEELPKEIINDLKSLFHNHWD